MDKDQKRKELLLPEKNGYDRMDEAMARDVQVYAEEYVRFLNKGKTERACVSEAIRLAEAAGFRRYAAGMALNPGDRIYKERFGKSLMLAVIGQRPLSEGVRMTAAHVDCPRLDLKPNPLYEDAEMALLKTHYYGGIKKYQWMAIPLALRGVVYRADGSRVDVCIGDEPDDPVLVITDLLPHLAADQVKKTVSEAFPAEGLNALAGLVPDGDEGSDRVKLAVMELLNKRYGITEIDFRTAELSLVPAGSARDVGLDRSMLGGYGHDDRVCSFAGLRALIDLDAPLHTCAALLMDKEEIGSVGVTGMQSAFIDMFMRDICGDIPLRRVYENSFCLSGDVCNAFDPNFADVSDKRNNALMGWGVGIFKYTGSRGKGGASDASAETMGRIRRMLDAQNVFWQVGELGKVDKGGGGTVAAYIANRNIEVVDAGVPVLSMHAPFEIISKLDNYMMYKACQAVYTG